MPGYCKAVTLKEVEAHGFVLTPGRYVGAADAEDDGVPFEEKFSILKKRLEKQFVSARDLEEQINNNLKTVVDDA